MMSKGRHVTNGRQGAFVRDAVIMSVGVLIVAALMYGILWLIQVVRSPDGFGAIAGEDTTTTLVVESPSTSVSTTTTSTTQPTTTTTAPTTTTTTAPVVEVRDPGEITVVVLNSIGTQGLAAGVTADLDSLGYVTLTADNYSPLLDQSRIWYKPGFGAEATDLAASFPDALTELNADIAPEADIVVLLGASYEGG